MGFDVHEIPLTRGYVAIIDAADIEIARRHRWHARLSGGGVKKPYAYTNADYDAETQSYRKALTLHALLLEPPPGFVVDHINGDTLDNRRANLRLATPSQNSANKNWRRGATGFRGVCEIKSLPETRARFAAVVGSRPAIGRFKDAETAARARDCVARILYGRFARLNFAYRWPSD